MLNKIVLILVFCASLYYARAGRYARSPDETPSNCRADWYNKCHSNDECCSKTCFRGESNSWKDGVCQAVNGTIVNSCLPQWNNNCTNSVDCCSGYCDKGAESAWLHGVCKSREIEGTKKRSKDEICRATWDNKCKSNIECCAQNCFFGPDNQWKFGVCRPHQQIDKYSSIKPDNNSKQNEDENCYPLFYEGCKHNVDCCSRLCDKQAGVKIGTCRPYTAIKLLDENDEWLHCFENWYAYCTKGEECCSGVCLQLNSTTNSSNNLTSFGVCTPDIRIIPVEIVNEIIANLSKTSPQTPPQTQTRNKRSTTVSDKKVVCYLGSWANYKKDDGKFVIEDIDPSLCTHLVYGFAKLEANKIASFDPWLDTSKDEPGGSLDAYGRFTIGLKEQNPSLKTLIAIGGWSEMSEKYSVMASTEASRKIFADSVVDFLDKFNFDGLDLDWEYPSTRGGNVENDKENLNELLRLLHDRLSDAGKMLTMAVSANPRTVQTGYDVATISELLDYISIMAYDYHGAFDSYTGHNAPLYSREDGEDLTFSVAFGVNFWLSNGAPREKLIIGLPLYGRTVKLADENNNGLAEKIIGPGDNGTYSDEGGMLYYREICQYFDDDEWTKEWDSTSMVPYMYKGDQWISYDNEQSLALKVHFAMLSNLGGIMFWSLEGDDYQDKCGKGQFSLLNSAKRAMSDIINVQNSKEDEEKLKEKCGESAADSMWFVSQFKSLFEWMNGKPECALRTQINFSREAVLISQIRSLVEAMTGDLEAARQTQIAFLKRMEENIDGIPIAGHIKAAVHCQLGQLEKCKEVALSATRPIFTIIGGAAGGLVAGPAGAVTGGLAGSTLFDGAVTAVESGKNHKYMPQGNLQSVEQFVTGKANPSEVFNTIFSLIGDGAGGLAGGKLATTLKRKIGIKSKDTNNIPAKDIVHCRRKRANGPGCTFFNDIEDFKPVPRLRVIEDTSKGPIVNKQINPDANNRVEYVHAHIQGHHIKKKGQKGTGSETSKKTVKHSKNMNGPIPEGHEPNDAGHVVGNQLGGSGKDTTNIIPQSGHMNKGAWLNEVEELVHSVVSAKGEAFYTIKPIYENAAATRPHTLRYKINGGDLELKGDLANPIIHLDDVQFIRDLDKRLYQLNKRGYINGDEIQNILKFDPVRDPKMSLDNILNPITNEKMSINYILNDFVLDLD